MYVYIAYKTNGAVCLVSGLARANPGSCIRGAGGGDGGTFLSLPRSPEPRPTLKNALRAFVVAASASLSCIRRVCVVSSLFLGVCSI